MNNIVIDVDDVSFSYSNIPVLKDISLKIYEDEFIGIIGPNASGKSTLLKLILGLIKPDKGNITVLNSKVKDLGESIGYVPQHITFLRDFPITVYEVIMMGHIKPKLCLCGYSEKEKQLAKETMQRLEIDTIVKRQIGTLSGGQLQRVLIARVLVSQPKILILDEPTVNIDIKKEEDIFAFLKNYSEHMTVIVVSHDVAFISGYVDRVACLNQTLVFHSTESISGKMIEDLYDTPIKMIHH